MRYDERLVVWLVRDAQATATATTTKAIFGSWLNSATRPPAAASRLAWAAPFVECLRTGHEHGDDCPASLAAYRDGIAEVDRVYRLTRCPAGASGPQAGGGRCPHLCEGATCDDSISPPCRTTFRFRVMTAPLITCSACRCRDCRFSKRQAERRPGLRDWPRPDDQSRYLPADRPSRCRPA